MSQIVFNKEYFESMVGRFEGVFEEIDTASQIAYHADHYSSMRAVAVRSIDDLRSIIRIIINSFYSTDQNMKEQAQKFLGVDVYNGILSAGQVIVNEDGSYVVKTYKGIVQPRGSNECTNMSTAAIIQRYRLIHDSSYNNEYGYGEGPIDIRSYVQGWSNKMSNTLPDGHTYKTDGSYQSSMTQTDLAILLSAHPEGVVLYGHYADCHGKGTGAHGIVITRYEQNPADGSYKFYAIDSVSNRDGNCERELTSTYLYDGGKSLGYYNHPSYNSVDELLNNMIAYQYISEFN